MHCLEKAKHPCVCSWSSRSSVLYFLAFVVFFSKVIWKMFRALWFGLSIKIRAHSDALTPQSISSLCSVLIQSCVWCRRLIACRTAAGEVLYKLLANFCWRRASDVGVRAVSREREKGWQCKRSFYANVLVINAHRAKCWYKRKQTVGAWISAREILTLIIKLFESLKKVYMCLCVFELFKIILQEFFFNTTAKFLQLHWGIDDDLEGHNSNPIVDGVCMSEHKPSHEVQELSVDLWHRIESQIWGRVHKHFCSIEALNEHIDLRHP